MQVDVLGLEQAIRAAALARTLGIPVVGDFEWPAEPRLDELMAVTDHLLLPRDVACTVTGAGESDVENRKCESDPVFPARRCS